MDKCANGEQNAAAASSEPSRFGRTELSEKAVRVFVFGAIRIARRAKYVGDILELPARRSEHRSVDRTRRRGIGRDCGL